MTQTNVPGTDRGPAPAAHRIRVRLLVSDAVMIGLPSLAWAVSASMASTLRATYTHTVNECGRCALARRGPQGYAHGR